MTDSWEEVQSLKKKFVSARTKYVKAKSAFLNRPRECEKCGTMTDMTWAPSSQWMCGACSYKYFGEE